MKCKHLQIHVGNTKMDSEQLNVLDYDLVCSNCKEVVEKNVRENMRRKL